MKSRILGGVQRLLRLGKTKSWGRAIAFCLAVTWSGSIASAQATSEAPQNVSIRFAQDVAPILRDRCVSCHGPTVQQAGLRLDSRFEMLRGGKSGPAITENNDADSLLIRRIAGNQAGLQMPPTGPLSAGEIETLRAWVRGGAPWDVEANFVQLHTVAPEERELFEALRQGQISTVRRILDNNPKLIHAVDESGSTPLILAAYWAGPNEVKEMLARGADPNAKNDSGVSALFPATENLETTRLLVEAGADVNARTNVGQSALMVAARRAGALPVVAYLLDKGGAVAAATQQGTTALHRAAESGDIDRIRLLLERGANVNAQQKNDEGSGRTPICSAARLGHGTAVRYLLAKGADPKLAGDALSFAVFQGNVEIVKALLEAGTEPTSTLLPEPMLVLACFSYNANLQIVKMLLEHGADPTAKGQQGKTPVQLARERGYEQIAQLLVDATGQKPSARKETP